MLVLDRQLGWFFGGVIATLIVATVASAALSRRAMSPSARATMDNVAARIRSWWVMTAIFVAAVLVGRLGAVVLFAVLSFFAMREFITLTVTRRADHRTVVSAFFVGITLQYYLVAIQWYGLFSILIPVYGFVYVPTQSVLSGDTEGFLERVAEIQWGLMVCVYCLSHAPALLMLSIPGYEGQNAKLLLYFVLVTQLSDVLQFVWGKLTGRHAIAPSVSPNKTVEGFVGGVLSATLIGAGLWAMTPFTPWQAAGMSLIIALMGFAGGLAMSAIKRDRGVKDFGTVIAGHGGILDRLDSMAFAAPVFFHVTRYYFTP